MYLFLISIVGVITMSLEDKIFTELSTDPAGLGYNFSTQTDAEILVLLFVVDRPLNVILNSNVLLTWAGKQGRLKKLTDGANLVGAFTALGETNQGYCLFLKTLIDRDDTTIDVSEGAVTALFTALVAASVLDSGDTSALSALGTKDISRAEEIGVLGVRTGHIQRMRVRIA